MQSKLNDEAPRQLEGFNFNMSMSAQTRGESATIRVQTVHKKTRGKVNARQVRM